MKSNLEGGLTQPLATVKKRMIFFPGRDLGSPGSSDRKQDCISGNALLVQALYSEEMPVSMVICFRFSCRRSPDGV